MEIRYSVCPHDCPDTCAWKVELEAGKVVRVSGDDTHPVTQGVICEKARYYPERIYGPRRVLYPMRRTGPKGSGTFERISWDEALEEIQVRWQVLIEKYGPESILPYSYAGTEGVINKGVMDQRFFNRLGATRLERTICSAAGGQGYKLAYGELRGFDPLDSVQAKLIIFWGINALETNLHQALLAEKARKNGAKLLVIDVHRNKTARWADDYYQILPGSDGALALGIAHILLREHWIDQGWTENHTLGLEALAAEAENYPPEKVARLTGLAVERLEELARIYALAKPSLIRIGNGLQHHDNGGMNTWAISVLPALTGAWQEVGGGALRHNSDYFPLNRQALERPDLIQGSPRQVNMIQLGRALTELNPPVRALYVYNSNPAAVAPEQRLVLKGLGREDLFTVVHEQVWTDTTRWADLVLPATSSLEHADLYLSYWHTVLQWAEPVIPPLGESRANIEVFKELAERMGFTEPCFQDTAEDVARQALATPYWQAQGITLERLRAERFIALQVKKKPFADGRFATPSGKAELKSERALQLGLTAVPTHRPLAEGPETLSSEFPFTLISPPNHTFLNSTFVDVTTLLAKAGRPTVEVHPQDAARLGITTGERVRLENERGDVVLTANVDDSVLPGVLVAPGVWWSEAYGDGSGVNTLTPDRLADLGHGAVFFSTLVKLTKI